MSAIIVPPDLASRLWPVIEPWIQAALAWHPFCGPEHVQNRLREGFAQLVMIMGADGDWCGAMILERVDYGATVACNVWLMGGRPRAFVDHRETLEACLDEWSRRHGCSTISLLGRPGWARILGGAWRDRQMVLAWRDADVSARAEPVPGPGAVH